MSRQMSRHSQTVLEESQNIRTHSDHPGPINSSIHYSRDSLNPPPPIKKEALYTAKQEESVCGLAGILYDITAHYNPAL